MALYLVRLAIMRARQSSKACILTRLFSKVWFPFQAGRKCREYNYKDD